MADIPALHGFLDGSRELEDSEQRAAASVGRGACGRGDLTWHMKFPELDPGIPEPYKQLRLFGYHPKTG